MVELKKNLWPAKIFLFVQLFSLTAFLFEQKILYLLNPNSTAPTVEYSRSLSGVSWSCFIILVTYFILCQVKTLRPESFRIVIPTKLVLLSLVIELIYVLNLFLSAESSKLLRGAIIQGQVSLGFAKLNTLLLYFMALLFFGKIGNKNYHVNKKDLLLIFCFFIVFFFKGLVFSSRGSFFNIIAFSLAGYTFFKSKSFLKIKALAVFFFGLLIGLGVLTTMRAGRILSDDDLFSSIVTKFSGNFAVSTNFIDNKLQVTDKYNLERSIWFDEKLNLGTFSLPRGAFTGLNYFPIKETISSFMSVVLGRARCEDAGYYFKIYNNLPFNSSNFLFKFLILREYFPLVFCCIFIFYNFFARCGPAACFFVYCLMVIFSLLSFTSNTFFEIPFCILPFLGLIFSKCFVAQHKLTNEKTTSN